MGTGFRKRSCSNNSGGPGYRSGDPTPSHADIQMTQAIVEMAKPFDVAVHDHIIVGRDGHASLKGLRLIHVRISSVAVAARSGCLTLS